MRPPAWLSNLLELLCEHIEPIRGEARAGYNFKYADPCWQIDLFLGKNELVGGSLDGLTDYVSYTANIAGILGLFSQIQRCEWLALPENLADRHNKQTSGLAIEGVWEERLIRVILRMTPPTEIGVGLKLFPDGSYAVA
ncbi:MAG: hypothetical protein JWM11_4275 [Planctomycetaceae bacterium]|nr:hypothetical protein [Planctomycetaceae bacterium]